MKKIFKKEILEHLIIKENLSYEEIGEMYCVTGGCIKKAAKRMGIDVPIRKTLPVDFVPHNKGLGKSYFCLNCKKLFYSSGKNPKYCSKPCSSEHMADRHYMHYLENQEKFCKSNMNMRFSKKHILKEQKNKCKICEIENVWNGKLIVFVLDHIDGDASNNFRNNLRLICPNCDSQLDTYKSKNKHSARKERYLLNYKNK